jgi:hypothetical protein
MRHNGIEVAAKNPRAILAGPWTRDAPPSSRECAGAFRMGADWGSWSQCAIVITSMRHSKNCQAPRLLRIPEWNTCFSPRAACPRRSAWGDFGWRAGLPGGTAGAGLLSTHAKAAGSTLSGSDTTTLPGLSLLRAGSGGEVAEDAELAGDGLADGGVGNARLAALPVKDLHRERRESALGTGQGGRLDRGRKLA